MPKNQELGGAFFFFRVSARSKVYIQGDLSIGTVDDLVFNETGSLEYLIVANEGKLVTVPWEAAKFNFEKQTASLNITQDQFKRVQLTILQAICRHSENKGAYLEH